MPSAEEVVGQIPIFADLKPKDLNKLVKEGHEVSFKAGADLTDDRGLGVTFFVVLEGSVEVVVQGQGVRKVGPGGYFGEMALIDRNPRSATVTAETDTTCIVFTRPVFRPFALNHPEVAWALLEMMVARVREAEARAAVA